MKNDSSPYFSIIVPVYNRENLISRCIGSVLTQSFEDFECIIVDDCSSDRTVEIVQSFDDKRIKLFCHKHNRGVCPARGTGTKHANSEWLIYLDSDWTLKSNALEAFYNCIQTIEDEVGIIGARLEIDNGPIWPTVVPDNTLNYIDWLKWKNECVLTGGGDYLSCRRKRAVNTYPWPEINVYETQIEYRILQKWKALIIDLVLGVEYLSTENSISRPRSLSSLWKKKNIANDISENITECLNKFGQNIKIYAPELYRQLMVNAIYWSFLANKRSQGLKYALEYLYRIKFSLSVFFMLVFGLIHRNVILFTIYLRKLHN